MRLEGKRVLVTGAATGIGKAVAEAMAAAGAVVVCADLNADGAAATAKALHKSRGGSHHAVGVDVASEASVIAMVEAAIAHTGGLDSAVTVAGIGMHKPFLEVSLADWQKVHGVNLQGTFLTCREVARHLVAAKRPGALVTIASGAATRASSSVSAYAATKGGVLSFTRAIAVDLAPHNIRVNAICPGPVATELVEKAHSAAMRKAFEATVAMHRYAKPAEIAGAAVFLASDEAGYITGADLAVDGGFVSSGVIVRT
jgi:NAD(P)-dependent dehydrogenase (short-subunit alcohol dehydrogenase family)